MLELLCPQCETANAVEDGADVVDVRCAECEGELDTDSQVHYFVADHPLLRGAQVYRELRRSIGKGLLRPDMWISEEGGPWFRGREREDLFAPRQPLAAPTAAHRAPSRSRPGRAPDVPGVVAAMAVLDYIGGVFLLVLTIPVFAIFASLGGGGAAFGLVLLPLGAGFVLFALAKALRRGSSAARTIQLILASLASVLLISLISNRAPGLIVFLGIVIVALPFLLLLNQEARDFFR